MIQEIEKEVTDLEVTKILNHLNLKKLTQYLAPLAPTRSLISDN